MIVIGRLFNKGVADFNRLVVIIGSGNKQKEDVKPSSGCIDQCLVVGKDRSKGRYSYHLAEAIERKVKDDYLGVLTIIRLP